MQGEEGERTVVAFGEDIDGEQQRQCMVQCGVLGAGDAVEDEVEFDQRLGALERIVAPLYQEGNRIVGGKGVVHNGTMSRSISRSNGK